MYHMSTGTRTCIATPRRVRCAGLFRGVFERQFEIEIDPTTLVVNRRRVLVRARSGELITLTGSHGREIQETRRMFPPSTELTIGQRTIIERGPTGVLECSFDTPDKPPDFNPLRELIQDEPSAEVRAGRTAGWVCAIAPRRIACMTPWNRLGASQVLTWTPEVELRPDVADLIAGSLCVASHDGVSCWNLETVGLSREVVSHSRVTQLAIIDGGGCLLDEALELWCWGGVWDVLRGTRLTSEGTDCLTGALDDRFTDVTRSGSAGLGTIGTIITDPAVREERDGGVVATSVAQVSVGSCHVCFSTIAGQFRCLGYDELPPDRRLTED